MVLLPLPVSPIIPIFSPEEIVRLILFSIPFELFLYLKDKFLNLISLLNLNICFTSLFCCD